MIVLVADVMIRRSAARLSFGAVNLLSALVVSVGVGSLPARYWLVDGAAFLVVVGFCTAGAGLLFETRWASTAARVASVVALVLGLLLVGALAVTASYLSGIYGPVGRGGAIILALSAALALPYLVVLPAAELVWLHASAVRKEASGTRGED